MNRVILFAAAALFLACQKDSGGDMKKFHYATVRCASGQTADRPYPVLSYMKFGGLCQGQGSYKSKDASQLSVLCRSYTSADATGKIDVAEGKIDEASGDCTFLTAAGGTRTITRDAAGNETVDGAPIACRTRRDNSTGSSGACDEAELAVPPDGPEEAAWLGVQGACVKDKGCREVTGLSDAGLKSEQTDCAGATSSNSSGAGTWRAGTCSLGGASYTTGCLKTPARAGEAKSTSIDWTLAAGKCPP